MYLNFVESVMLSERHIQQTKTTLQMVETNVS